VKERKAADPARREFLGVSAAIAAITLAPGVMLYEYAHAKKPGEKDK